MKVSIVIPHYGDRAHDLLDPCIRSIYKFTDLSDTEVIVVCNGATEDAWNFCELMEVKGIWFDEAIGYTRACNEGMKVAKGEYIVLLNNDTVLLEQPKNLWIDMLLRAFWDSKVALAGPWMNWCSHAEQDFLVFFCVMIRREALDHIGFLDEVFSPGYGEDCALCCEARQKGWRVVQVPDSTKLEYNGSMALGQFPIYHKGNETFRNWPGGDELLRKNRQILHERYATGIAKAHEIDGYMSNEELSWLATTVKSL